MITDCLLRQKVFNQNNKNVPLKASRLMPKSASFAYQHSVHGPPCRGEEVKYLRNRIDATRVVDRITINGKLGLKLKA